MMRDAPAYRIWPPLALGIPLLVGALASRVWPDRILISPLLRGTIEVALVLFFLAVNGTAYLMMWRARTGILPGESANAILDRGPFARSRNPLYVGLLALYAAIALWDDTLWGLLLLPAAFALLWWGAVAPEERYLEAKFGEQYLSYKRRVRRWL